MTDATGTYPHAHTGLCWKSGKSRGRYGGVVLCRLMCRCGWDTEWFRSPTMAFAAFDAHAESQSAGHNPGHSSSEPR